MDLPHLPGALVSADWLREHLSDVQVADVRWYLDGRSGRDAYLAGHIPTAVWVDLDRDLAGPPTPAGGRHPLPEPAQLASALGRLGISYDRPVVAYDDAAGSIAARLWWMLRAIGQDAAVLDGGIAAWGAGLESGAAPDAAADATPDALPDGAPADRPAVDRPAPAWPAGAVVTTSEVDRLRRLPDVVLLDARAPARYQGVEETVDARSGHIPGARNSPWAANVDDEGRFLAPARLRERFTAAGVPGARQVIASCGSGVTACHNLLALEVAGLPGGALYAGSWSAWAAASELPTALGPEPG